MSIRIKKVLNATHRIRAESLTNGFQKKEKEKSPPKTEDFCNYSRNNMYVCSYGVSHMGSPCRSTRE